MAASSLAFESPRIDLVTTGLSGRRQEHLTLESEGKVCVHVHDNHHSEVEMDTQATSAWFSMEKRAKRCSGLKRSGFKLFPYYFIGTPNIVILDHTTWWLLC